MADSAVDFEAYVDVRFHFALATYACASCACVASENQASKEFTSYRRSTADFLKTNSFIRQLKDNSLILYSENKME